MALTQTEIARTVFGNKRVVLTDVTFDASYPTGGESFLPADVGLVAIDAVIAASHAIDSTPVIRAVQYDPAAGTLLAFLEDFTEVTAATDLSAFTVTLQVIGI